MVHTVKSLMQRPPDATTATRAQSAERHSQAFIMPDPEHAGRSEAKQVYFDLLQDEPDDLALARSRQYLTKQLANVAGCATDLPGSMKELRSWSEANSLKVGAQYRQYLESRKSGHPRQYFAGKAHALYFLKSVAPTKLVDGAWLYGLLRRWNEPRFLPLIQTYLEELGEGDPDKNHVVIYKKLLAAHGCQQWPSLHDTYFVQGAIQLALAQHAGSFLPEVIGYNLGYEQLPLHLLICAYELKELGIDPYYFTLHVTVDNAATGHAVHAVQGVFDAIPQVTNKEEFHSRIIDGFNLNALGANTVSIISQFNLEEELLAILSAKSRIGAQLHSDYCKIAEKTVNEWLSDPAQLPSFLDALQRSGWIKRHRDPSESRFWTLIQGDRARMFGVFNAYEKQVIHDWIAGERLVAVGPTLSGFQAVERSPRGMVSSPPIALPFGNTDNCCVPQWNSIDTMAPRGGDFDIDMRLLEQKLADPSAQAEAKNLVIKLMAPVHHHTEAGLMATRIFAQWLRNE